jgi:hypothetical protein
MVRKYLFLGLMVMLLATLVSLVVQGRKKEQEQREKSLKAPLEIVRTSPSSPTRVLAPADLAVVEAGGGSTAGLQNLGGNKYRSPMLRLGYLDRKGKSLGNRDRGFDLDLPAGQTIALPDLDPPDAPAGWARRSIRVLYAELAPN